MPDDQMDLFNVRPITGGGAAAPRYPRGPGHRGVPTSVDAARAILPAMKPQQREIVEHLRSCADRGATYVEIHAATGIAVPSVCGRMRELVEAGVVLVSGETRLTPSRRRARVYKVNWSKVVE